MAQSKTMATNGCTVRHWGGCLPKCVAIVAELLEAVMQIPDLVQRNCKEEGEEDNNLRLQDDLLLYYKLQAWTMKGFVL